jgi:hypothetical protein
MRPVDFLTRFVVHAVFSTMRARYRLTRRRVVMPLGLIYGGERPERQPVVDSGFPSRLPLSSRNTCHRQPRVGIVQEAIIQNVPHVSVAY